MNSVINRAIRLPLRAVPAHSNMLMLAPRELRGFRWIAGAGVHGCWIGTYEHAKRRVFVGALHEGAVVLDVGAQAGYYSLLASRLVGATGRVVAFEPLPRNLLNLHRHLELNHVQNVEVIAAAAADHTGGAQFSSEPSGYMGRLDDSGDVTVETVTLDAVTAAMSLRPDVVKIDVEGGEAAVLRGASRLLSEVRPTIFLATHGTVAHSESCALLRAAGYALTPLDVPDLAAAREILAR